MKQWPIALIMISGFFALTSKTSPRRRLDAASPAKTACKSYEICCGDFIFSPPAKHSHVSRTQTTFPRRALARSPLNLTNIGKVYLLAECLIEEKTHIIHPFCIFCETYCVNGTCGYTPKK